MDKPNTSFNLMPTDEHLRHLGIGKAFFEAYPQQVFKEVVREGIHYTENIDFSATNLYFAERLLEELKDEMPIYLETMRIISPTYSEMEIQEYRDYLIKTRQTSVRFHRSNLCNLLFSEN